MMLRKKLLCNVNRQRISFLKSLISGSSLWLASPKLACLGLGLPFFLDPGNSCSWLWDVTSFFFLFFPSFLSQNVKKFRHKNVTTGKTQFLFFFHFFFLLPFFRGNKGKMISCYPLGITKPKAGGSPRRLGLTSSHWVSRAFPQFLFR